MRIIAGKYKGRKLNSVRGTTTRPTSSKVKEAVFHMIGPFFGGGVCLDLFAGSGALGVEAISRGMDQSIFVERNSKAIRTINENIEKIKADKYVEILSMDALRALKLLQNQGRLFDLIFIDPPYQNDDMQTIIKEIISNQLLHSYGKIVCEHDSTNQLPHILGLKMIKQSTYGSTAITIYKAE